MPLCKSGKSQQYRPQCKDVLLNPVSQENKKNKIFKMNLMYGKLSQQIQYLHFLPDCIAILCFLEDFLFCQLSC